MVDLSDLETKAAAGTPFTRADAERMLACPDLVSIGMIGEAARKHGSGDRVTYGRVCPLPEAGAAGLERGDAGEIRLVGSFTSFVDAHERVRAAAAFAGGAPLTGFTLMDLLEACGHDHLALVEGARALRAAGLEAVAEVPLDRASSDEDLVEVVRAVAHGGLGVWRLTIDRAALGERLDLIGRAHRAQTATGAFRAFAPLPRVEAADAPSTGYDDVRTIALARVLCPNIPLIQVDWPLYGPKLAQVAIAYGANDVDGVAAVDTLNLGARRSPAVDVARQIRAAGAEPVERNGRYEVPS